MAAPQYTGKEIWERLFWVRMPYLASRNLETMRVYGVRVSGIQQLDKERESEMITTELTIDAMFEKWRAGVTVRVMNYNDTEIIYRIIQDHILRWTEQLTYGVNIGNAPLKDLIELDEFATVVYQKAQGIFSPQQRQEALASNFSNMKIFTFQNVLNRATKPVTGGRIERIGDGVEVMHLNEEKPVEEKKGLPERSSFKEFFEDRINQISSWRGE